MGKKLELQNFPISAEVRNEDVLSFIARQLSS
jgi:hypothetical protein